MCVINLFENTLLEILKGLVFMSYKVCVLQKNKMVEELSLKYSLLKNDGSSDMVSTFDIEVEKVSNGVVQKEVCYSVSSNIEVATSILEVLYRNDVLPETLFEVMEECFELVL